MPAEWLEIFCDGTYQTTLKQFVNIYNDREQYQLLGHLLNIYVAN